MIDKPTPVVAYVVNTSCPERNGCGLIIKAHIFTQNAIEGR